MEDYYNRQTSSMPHFSGHYRQRGSGFGALAAGIGRVALPIARKFVWPVAKSIGRDLLMQAAPEMINIATKQKTPKQALKSAVVNTARKQVGGAAAKRRKRAAKPKSKRKTIVQKTKPRRSRLDFFSKVKDAK